jgi:Tfp pilus assembly protein PilN
MRRIDLDFERRQGPRVLAYLLLLAGAALAVAAAGQYQSISLELEAQEQVLRQFQSKPRQQSGADPRSQRDRDQRLAGAGAVLSRLAVPWDALFKGLESVDEPDVALLALSPDAAKQQIKLGLEAKNMAAMVSYHSKLEQTPIFADVSFAQHEIEQQDPNRPVRFTISASWVAPKEMHAAQ